VSAKEVGPDNKNLLLQPQQISNCLLRPEHVSGAGQKLGGAEQSMEQACVAENDGAGAECEVAERE